MTGVQRISAAALCAAFLSACGGGGGGATGTPGALPPSGASPEPSITTHESTLNPVPQNAAPVTITEYSNPLYRAHGGITVTNDGVVWWDANAPGGAAPYNLIRMQGSRQTPVSMAVVNSTSFYPRGLMAATPDGRAWEDVVVPTPFQQGGQPQTDDVFVYATSVSQQAAPSGGIDAKDIGMAGIANLATDTSGNLWFVAPASIFMPGAEFGFIPRNGNTATRFYPNSSYQLTAITPGPDGNMWIAGLYPQQAFGRFSTSGNFIDTLSLPAQLQWINGAVLGPDRAVWFVDNVDSVVGRISGQGRVNVYPTLTPNASPDFITVGGDGALWFTEYDASKIGRITTSGQMTEYALPTSNSGPYQIVGPSNAGCGPTQLWIAEQRSGKIAQLLIKT